jgi:hypothetical protein
LFGFFFDGFQPLNPFSAVLPPRRGIPFGAASALPNPVNL